jgi:hypothetical protein
MEGGNARPDGIDDANALVAKDASGCTGRDIAFQNVQVGPADRCLDDLHGRIAGRSELRLRTFLYSLLSWSTIYKRLHGKLLLHVETPANITIDSS